MIETIALTKRYGGYTAADNVTLSVGAGETFGFLGLNGAGKTTVMRMICGLLRPTSGYSRVGEAVVRGPRDTERLIDTLSFVSQEMRFYEQATLCDLLSTYAVLAGKPADPGLRFARLAGVPLDRSCGKMSPGQQRKAQLAIALLKEPRYLLLDEPTAGLDPQGVSEVRDIVRSLNASGATVFLSSHILSEVQTLCRSVAILHQGRLCYQGQLEEAYVISVASDPAAAARILQEAGIRATVLEGAVRVSLPQADLPAAVQRLAAHNVPTGLVQPASLEDTFQKMIRGKEARNELAKE